MNLDRRLLQSLREASAAAWQLICLAPQAASQLWPEPPATSCTPAGSGGAGGTGTCGLPSYASGVAAGGRGGSMRDQLLRSAKP